MRRHLQVVAAGAVLLLGFGATSALAQATAQTDTSTGSTKKHSHKTKKADTSDTATLAPASAAAPEAAKTTAKTPRTPANNASDAEIAAAQSGGKVWVNTETKVYHKSGRFYGKTKRGKFMTEGEAQAAGYHPAKAEIGVKK